MYLNVKDDFIDADEIIDAAGGTFKVATLCEVSPPAVSAWRKNGIPKARLMYLRLAAPEAFSIKPVYVQANRPDPLRDVAPRRGLGLSEGE